MGLAVLTLDRRQSPRQKVSWAPIVSHRADDETRCVLRTLQLPVKKVNLFGGIAEREKNGPSDLLSNLLSKSLFTQ